MEVGWSAGWLVVLVHVQVAVPEERILLGSMPADSLQPGDEVNGVLLQPVGYGEGSGILGDRGSRAYHRRRCPYAPIRVVLRKAVDRWCVARACGSSWPSRMTRSVRFEAIRSRFLWRVCAVGYT